PGRGGYAFGAEREHVWVLRARIAALVAARLWVSPRRGRHLVGPHRGALRGGDRAADQVLPVELGRDSADLAVALASRIRGLARPPLPHLEVLHLAQYIAPLGLDS